MSQSPERRKQHRNCEAKGQSPLPQQKVWSSRLGADGEGASQTLNYFLALTHCILDTLLCFSAFLLSVLSFRGLRCTAKELHSHPAAGCSGCWAAAEVGMSHTCKPASSALLFSMCSCFHLLPRKRAEGERCRQPGCTIFLGNSNGRKRRRRASPALSNPVLQGRGQHQKPTKNTRMRPEGKKSKMEGKESERRKTLAGQSPRAQGDLV